MKNFKHIFILTLMFFSLTVLYLANSLLTLWNRIKDKIIKKISKYKRDRLLFLLYFQTVGFSVCTLAFIPEFKAEYFYFYILILFLLFIYFNLLDYESNINDFWTRVLFIVAIINFYLLFLHFYTYTDSAQSFLGSSLVLFLPNTEKLEEFTKRSTKINNLCFPRFLGPYKSPFHLNSNAASRVRNRNNSLAFWSLNFKNLRFNNSCFNNFIHSSAILSSDFENELPLNSEGPRKPKSPILEALVKLEEENRIKSENRLPINSSESGNSSSYLSVALARLENERLSDLPLFKYQGKPVEEEEIEFTQPSTSYAESFPWFVDDEGRPIDFNKPIAVFNGVKLISKYLETRYRADPNLISEAKISDLLELFKDNKTVTVYDLFGHVDTKFREDRGSFSEKLSNETEPLTTMLPDSSNTSLTNSSKTSKPLGEYGEVSLNKIGVFLKENLNWEFVFDKTRVTVHGIPAAVSAISYGLIIKGYIKYAKNRPVEIGLSPKQLECRQIMRNRQCGLFFLFGAPLTLFLMRNSSLALKDIFSLTVGGASQVENNNSNLINTKAIGTLFLFLSNLNKKLPRWLKILFRFLILTILVLKLLGFSFLSVFLINNYIWKIVYSISCSLVISYFLLSLYLLHKFSQKNLQISEVLPEFLIEWLKEIEDMSSSKAGIKEFKTSCYIELTIYITLLVLLTILIP